MPQHATIHVVLDQTVCAIACPNEKGRQKHVQDMIHRNCRWILFGIDSAYTSEMSFLKSGKCLSKYSVISRLAILSFHERCAVSFAARTLGGTGRCKILRIRLLNLERKKMSRLPTKDNVQTSMPC